MVERAVEFVVDPLELRQNVSAQSEGYSQRIRRSEQDVLTLYKFCVNFEANSERARGERVNPIRGDLSSSAGNQIITETTKSTLLLRNDHPLALQYSQDKEIMRTKLH